VKVLYEQDAGETKVKICKTCRAAIKHGKKSLAVPAASKEAAPAG
jgi:ferredoxin